MTDATVNRLAALAFEYATGDDRKWMQADEREWITRLVKRVYSIGWREGFRGGLFVEGAGVSLMGTTTDAEAHMLARHDAMVHGGAWDWDKDLPQGV